MGKVLLLLYIIAIVVIGFLLYSMTDTAQKQKQKNNRVQNGIPPPQRFNTHWWGYGWRPWWRKYNGLPGFTPEEGKPLPDPKMPVAPKPVVINTKPILY